MFRRRAAKILRKIISPNVPPMLQRAHQMLEQADYENAAIAFYELAQKAEQRFPQHAPMLYIQAGRASILNGQNQKGVVHFRSGLTLLGTERRFARLEKIGNIIITELRERGLISEANEIEEVLKNNLPAALQKETTLPKKKIVLPTHCPSCGAIVKPDEVEWLDEITAECDYCGSPVRAGSNEKTL